MIFDYFAKAYYINLNVRQDRRREAEKRFRDFNIEVTRYGAEKPTDRGGYDGLGARGAAESHFEIIRLAKQDNLENVLIFEDDVVFTKPYREILAIVGELKHVNWDMFYFYVWPGTKTLGKFGIFQKVTNQTMAHAYAVNGHFYDTILTKCVTNNKHIDVFYAQDVQPNNNIYASATCVGQSLSPTDASFWHDRRYSSHAENNPILKQAERPELCGKYFLFHYHKPAHIVLQNNGLIDCDKPQFTGTWDSSGKLLILKFYHHPALHFDYTKGSGKMLALNAERCWNIHIDKIG